METQAALSTFPGRTFLQSSKPRPVRISLQVFLFVLPAETNPSRATNLHLRSLHKPRNPISKTPIQRPSRQAPAPSNPCSSVELPAPKTPPKSAPSNSDYMQNIALYLIKSIWNHRSYIALQLSFRIQLELLCGLGEINDFVLEFAGRSSLMWRL